MTDFTKRLIVTEISEAGVDVTVKFGVSTSDSSSKNQTEKVDEVMANMLCRAVMSEIETYAIHIALFDVNESPRIDEIIAHRLGMLPIDQTKYQHISDEHQYHVDFTGPGWLTTEHIPDIPFVNLMGSEPIAIIYLQTGDHVVFDVKVRKGKGLTHSKWSPVSSARINATNDGFVLKFKNIGMMPSDEIVRAGIEKMPAAIARPAPNLYFNQIIPTLD